MPITRAKASQLLNQREMALYDDSRINGLRRLDAKALASRVQRARTARDRARDLVRKHKLASRDRTGSKRGSSGTANQRSKDKAELLADILKRFEAQLRDVGREEKAAARRKPAKAATKKAATTTKAAGRKAAKAASRRTAKQAAASTAARGGGRAAASTSAARNAPGTRRASAAKAAKASTKAAAKQRVAARRPRKLTPAQALEQTRALLEAKHERDQEPKPWRELPGEPVAAGQPGFQSDSAARRARRLHAAEARIPAIQGSISTRDRINQGKRDHRGDSGE